MNQTRKKLSLKLDKVNTKPVLQKEGVIVLTPKKGNQMTLEEFKKQYNALKEHLRELFPKCFVKGNYLPLKRRIHKDLLAKNVASPRVINKFMHRYTKTIKYLQALVEKEYRVDLDGLSIEKVSEADKEHAKEMLLEIEKKRKK